MTSPFCTLLRLAISRSRPFTGNSFAKPHDLDSKRCTPSHPADHYIPDSAPQKAKRACRAAARHFRLLGFTEDVDRGLGRTLGRRRQEDAERQPPDETLIFPRGRTTAVDQGLFALFDEGEAIWKERQSHF